jgi:hypothetical protein
LLLAEVEGEHRLRRVLGPMALTSLGIGCIIGTGIFVLTGIAAHDKTGPTLALSFVVAAGSHQLKPLVDGGLAEVQHLPAHLPAGTSESRRVRQANRSARS